MAALADRVMIMDQGSVVAEGEVAELVRKVVGRQVFEISGPHSRLEEVKRRLEECDVEVEENGIRLFVYLRTPCSVLETISVEDVTVMKRPANLEDLFLRLTGRALRED